MNRRLWLDTRGLPVITTTSNGERNAARWGWTPATARPLPTSDEIEQAVNDSADFLDWETCREIADAVLDLLKGQNQ